MTLFVGDDKGQTYKIILVPKSIPGEEVILKPPPERENCRCQHDLDWQGSAVPAFGQGHDLVDGRCGLEWAR